MRTNLKGLRTAHHPGGTGPLRPSLLIGPSKRKGPASRAPVCGGIVVERGAELFQRIGSADHSKPTWAIRHCKLFDPLRANPLRYHRHKRQILPGAEPMADSKDWAAYPRV